MRVDKYLWCIRVFKSRAIASAECNKNRVSVEGKTLKPAKELTIGDTVNVRKNQIIYSYRVIAFPKSRVGAKLVNLYAMNMTDPEELKKLERVQNNQSYYREKGEGRPTKRDRRDLDDYLSGDDFDF